MTDEKFFDELSSMINKAFDGAFGRKPEDSTLPNITKRLNDHFEVIGTETGTTRPVHTRKKDPKKVLTKASKSDIIEPSKGTKLYESIEDYTAKTGKRFRMTKRQKELKMTREEAFKLTHGEC